MCFGASCPDYEDEVSNMKSSCGPAVAFASSVDNAVVYKCYVKQKVIITSSHYLHCHRVLGHQALVRSPQTRHHPA